MARLAALWFPALWFPALGLAAGGLTAPEPIEGVGAALPDGLAEAEADGSAVAVAVGLDPAGRVAVAGLVEVCGTTKLNPVTGWRIGLPTMLSLIHI